MPHVTNTCSTGLTVAQAVFGKQPARGSFVFQVPWHRSFIASRSQLDTYFCICFLLLVVFFQFVVGSCGSVGALCAVSDLLLGDLFPSVFTVS